MGWLKTPYKIPTLPTPLPPLHTHTHTNGLQGLVTNTTILGVDHIFMHVVTMDRIKWHTQSYASDSKHREGRLESKKPSAMNDCY